MSSNRNHLLVIFVVTFCGHLPIAVLSTPNASQPILYELVEKSPAGTLIGNVFEDSGLATIYQNQAVMASLRVSFRTPGPSYLIYFTLNETTGVLRTSTNPLDRDRQCPYKNTCVLNLEVQVLPTNYFQLFTVAIDVVDINDHAPNFTPNFVRLNISESDAALRLYPLPPVDDPDGGDSNGIQAFRLEPNSTTFQLSVGFLADGSADVQLRLMEQLERSKVGFYSLTVLAVDGGTPPRTGSLAINVTVIDSVNLAQSLAFDNSTYEVTVAESLPTGSVVLRVKASYQGPSGVASSPTAAAAAGQILYDIESSAQRNQVFGINRQSGEIYVNASLDFRASPLLLLTLSASDRSRSTSQVAYARVTVHVTDTNNNAPVLKVTTFTADGVAEVNDSASVGSFVAYVGVTDADDGINAEVSCVINSTTFRLDPIEMYKDYILKTAVKFARGHPTQYAVAVNCTDRGSPRMTSAVVVSIRVNSAGPVFSSDRTLVDFYENNSLGDTIEALNVTYDPPPDSPLLFGLSSSLDDSPLAAISVDPNSGVVTANVIFKYDVRRQFSYVMTVSNPRSQHPTTATATLVINILQRPIPTGGATARPPPASLSSSSSEPPAVALTVGQESAGPQFKDSSSVIITAVVCATVIVVVIIVVVAVTVVCCRRNHQKAMAAAAVARMAKEDSMSSDGAKHLVRSLSSVSSSVASTSGDSRRESRLGSIKEEESFEEENFHRMHSAAAAAEWPPIDGQTSYSDCGLVGATDMESSLAQPSMKRGLYVRSVSHPDNQHRASRSYGNRCNIPEDGSETSRSVESESYYSDSVTDSGRGNSLQEDGAPASSSSASSTPVAPFSLSPRSNAPQQVFRTESDCSGSSGRPLVAAQTRYPIENKIYITNHFRDALPRHPPRMTTRAAAAKKNPTPVTVGDVGDREDPPTGVIGSSRKQESNRSDYFDARSRASHHVSGQERYRSPNGVGSRSPERLTSSAAAPKGHKSRVGEFTRSLHASGHEVCKNHSPTRHVSPHFEQHRTNNADQYDNHVGDTFV